MALELTSDNFQTEVLESDKPVVVDFWAEWCGPCRMISPIIEEIGEELKEQIKVGKLNVDHHSAISSQYGIRNIPTILIFKGGEVVDKIVGALPKPMLVSKLQPYLS